MCTNPSSGAANGTASMPARSSPLFWSWAAARAASSLSWPVPTRKTTIWASTSPTRCSSHKHRLTYPRQLIAYREFLKDGGEIYFKTDDDDLFRDSVEYFPASGYDIEWITYDLHENEPEWNIRTEHEGMFTEMGIKIKALIARKKPGADSVTWVDPKVLKRMAREAAAAEAAAQEGEENV